ncbi:hypothetical protein [Zoogloea sp. LCSB751]|uniref:hypothetical protein n=1 Tax=Zoogloea sp. LCSB751 TaxID=1965277 RepID=UPI001117714D|nr:hypothetical protein [Zoogloea sp. LCSB751]
MKVFWSWQSDSPGKKNHFFVRDALALALKQVAADLGLTEAERPEVDHDTKGEPGLVSIVDTIFEKISQAAVFVGDLTYVGKTENGKLLPNPNVMIELGHAITSLGPERIILVTNRAYGGRPEDLPFDLRHRRAPISYDLPETASTDDRKRVQRELVGALASALAGCLGRVLDQAAKSYEYPGAPARPGDKSTWLMNGEPIQHHGYFHEGGASNWTVLEEPRFYLRVIPARYDGNWRPRDIHDLPQPYRLNVLHPWINGDGGVNPLGVVAVGIGRDGKALAATQWFKKTSEVWAFNCNATFVDPDSQQRLLAWGVIPNSWREHLERTLALLNHIGAKGPLQVEAGVTGLQNAVWGSKFGRRYPTLESEIYMGRADTRWEPQTQVQFLTEVFNLLGEAYNQPAFSIEEFLRIH